jgi:hypothetical protein
MVRNNSPQYNFQPSRCKLKYEQYDRKGTVIAVNELNNHTLTVAYPQGV